MLLGYQNVSLFFKGESDVSSVLSWTVYTECPSLHQHLRKIIPILTFLKMSFVFSGKNIRSLWKLMVCLVASLISTLYRHFLKCCAGFFVVIIPSGSCEVKKPLKATGGPSHLLAHQSWLVKGVMSQWTKPELQLQAFPAFRRPRLRYMARQCCKVIKLLPAI